MTTETIELKVDGMTCDGCERSVGNALGRVEGVTSVEADHSTGMVTVIADRPVPRAALESAVHGAGYDIAP